MLPRHELSKMKACEVMKPLAQGFLYYQEVRVSVRSLGEHPPSFSGSLVPKKGGPDAVPDPEG